MNKIAHKVCCSCKINKPITDFHIRRGGRSIRSDCKTCDHTKSTERDRFNRRDPLKRSRFIIKDTRASDSRSHRDNDLTLSYVELSISKPCSYCDSTDRIMTLDRIDNDIGHTMDNTVPCCLRCNYIRGNMPYDAWLIVSQAVKHVDKLGLFGDWRLSPTNRNHV